MQPLRGVRAAATAASLGLALALPGAAYAHGGQYRGPAGEVPPTGREPVDPPPPPSPSGRPGTPTPPPVGGGERPLPTPTPRPRPLRRTATPALDDWTAWWFIARDPYLVRTARRVASGASGLDSPEGVGDAGVAPAGAADRAWKRRALEGLRQAFPSEDAEIFTGCAIALGKGGEPADGALLLRALERRYPDGSLRESLALGTGLLGPAARGGRDALAALLADRKEPARLRGLAALALGFSGDPAAAPALLAAARDRGPSMDPSAPAILALGLLGEPLLVPDLAEMLADETTNDAEALRPHAAFSLGRLGGKEAVRALSKALADSDVDVRRAAILALGECDPADTADLAPVLARGAREDRDRVCRGFAMVVLGRMGGVAAQDALSRCFAVGDRGERNFAALGLGILGRGMADVEARGRIAGALRSAFLEREDADFRGALAIALGLLRDEKAVPALREVLKRRGDPELRSHCALALGLVGGPDGVDELLAALVEKGSPDLQREAALALGLLGDAGAARVLADLVGGSAPEHVRASAARALGEIGGEAAAEALGKLLADRSAGGASRGQAAVGLGLLIDPRVPGALANLSRGLNYFATTPAIVEALTIP